jgi:hypothetical protein
MATDSKGLLDVPVLNGVPLRGSWVTCAMPLHAEDVVR